MDKNVKNVFESLKENKDKKIVYSKDDISILLDVDSSETKEQLERIYNRSVTLIEKYRKNKMNIFQEAVSKKNKSVCEFIISKPRFENLYKPIHDIINADFVEILPLYIKYNKSFSYNEWSSICSKASFSFINEILENNRAILKEIKKDDFINPLFQFIYSRSDSIKPLKLIKSELTQSDINSLWSSLLKYCESVLMHQAMINEDILPDSLIFNDKPLLIEILHCGNYKIFDFYQNNEFLYNEAIKYFENTKNNLYQLSPYSAKTGVKKLISVYKNIDITDRNSILPDPQDFVYISSERNINYFLDILKSDPIFYKSLYKKYNDERKEIYIDEFIKIISKVIDKKDVDNFKIDIEKLYILSNANINKMNDKEQKKEKRL